MMIVVVIIAVLAGVGYNYYGDSIEEARLNTVKINLRTVKDAIARYFKDHLTYPKSLDQLRGPYLMQSVNELLITPLGGDAQIELNISSVAGANVYHSPESDMIWTSNLNTGEQFKNIRVKFQGIYLY